MGLRVLGGSRAEQLLAHESTRYWVREGFPLANRRAVQDLALVVARFCAAFAGAGCTPAPAEPPAPLSIDQVVPQIIDAAIADARRSFREGGNGPLLIDIRSFQDGVLKGLGITVTLDSIGRLIGRPFREASVSEAFQCDTGGVCTVVDDGVFLQMRALRHEGNLLVTEVFWSHPYRRDGTPWITCSRTLELSFTAQPSWQLATQRILEAC